MNKFQLVFDTTAPNDFDNTGAYLRASDGTLLTHTDNGGKKSLDVHVANTVTVQGTDIDIRDITHVSDSIKIGDGTDFLAINADGSINVNADISVTNGHEKAEDAAHASGDVGSYILSVRQDTLASSTSTDGDYQSFKTDSLGRLYVNVDKAAPPTFTSWLNSQNTVTTVAELVVAADLTNRKRMVLQNVSNNKTLYIGSSNAVTSADGMKLPAGTSWEIEVAAGTAVYAIASAAGTDLRIAEFAA